MVLKTFVVILCFIGCCFSVSAEQMISLPGHYALSDIAAVSFPSSAVHILNSSSVVNEPFHVICDHIGSGQLECVSSLEERGLYVYGTFGESCFASKSIDPRFVIGTPVPGDNNCVLDAIISDYPGLLERAFNPVVSEEKVSRWSIDAAKRVPRVNAYERVVAIMKYSHVDFKNQILLKSDLPVLARDFTHMIMSGRDKSAAFEEEDFYDEEPFDMQKVIYDLERGLGHFNHFAREWNRLFHEILHVFHRSGPFANAIQRFCNPLYNLCNKVIEILTLNGRIPIGMYANPMVLLVGFCLCVIAMLLFAVVVRSFLAIIVTLRTILSIAKPLMVIVTTFIIFLLLIK